MQKKGCNSVTLNTAVTSGCVLLIATTLLALIIGIADCIQSRACGIGENFLAADNSAHSKCNKPMRTPCLQRIQRAYRSSTEGRLPAARAQRPQK